MEKVGRTALVTGATGFIGQHLARRLLADGWLVRILARNPNKLSTDLAASCDIVVGDLFDEEAIRRAARKVDAAFHCAANVNTWDTWEAYHSVNVTGVRNIAVALAIENPGLKRLVHLSTADVYGFPDSPCDETAPTDGAGFGYGESKLLGERVLKETCDSSGISYTIFRPCNVIGPGSQFIGRIGKELKSGLMLTIDGGRSNAGLLYVHNLVDCMVWAAMADQAHRQTYNVRDACDVDWTSFLRVLRARIGGRGIVIDLPFGIAEALARILEAAHKLILPEREPLLHRLLVRIFGRTCGHSAQKLRGDIACIDRIGFEQAMEESGRWFLDAASKA